jgi:hypothetical protein
MCVSGFLLGEQLHNTHLDQWARTRYSPISPGRPVDQEQIDGCTHVGPYSDARSPGWLEQRFGSISSRSTMLHLVGRGQLLMCRYLDTIVNEVYQTLRFQEVIVISETKRTPPEKRLTLQCLVLQLTMASN